MGTKIQEWYNAIVEGLNNGLAHTTWDGRRDDINWVRKRLELWEAFGRCVFAFYNEQDWSSNEKDLFEIAKEGYKFKQTSQQVKRQGMIVTIDQLRTLADDLEIEVKDNKNKYEISGYGTKFQINIINPQEECSDTWKIEDLKDS